MFTPRQRPLLLVGDRLLSLRLSLNTPVVSTHEVPAGPARAAIAVHLEAGQRCITVVVRSLRNGDSTAYELENEELHDDSGMDAALSFGESMGFLFDDEAILDRREETLREAVARLRELVAPPGIAEDVPESPAREPDAPEILLEEAVELEAAPLPVAPDPPARELAPGGILELSGPGPVEASEVVAGAPPAVAPALPLTKFRSAPAAAPAPPAASPPTPPAAGGASEAGSPPRAATLGRVRPVRLRQGGDGPPPIDPLLRLLSAF